MLSLKNYVPLPAPVSTTAGAQTLMQGLAGFRQAGRDREQAKVNEQNQENRMHTRGVDDRARKAEALTTGIGLLKSGDPAAAAQAQALFDAAGITAAEVSAAETQPPAPPAPPAPSLAGLGGMPAHGMGSAPPAPQEPGEPPPPPAPPELPAGLETPPATDPVSRATESAAPAAPRRPRLSLGGLGANPIDLDLGAYDDRERETAKGLADTASASGVPTTADVTPEQWNTYLRAAGGDQAKAHKMAMDEVAARRGSASDALDRDARAAQAVAQQRAAMERTQVTVGAREAAADAKALKDEEEAFYKAQRSGKSQLGSSASQARINAYGDLSSVIARIDQAPDDARVYGSALYGLAKANDGGGRLSNQDVELSAGVMSLMEEAKMLGEQRLAGTIDAGRMAAIRKTLADQLRLWEGRIKEDYAVAEGILEMQPSERTARGYETELRQYDRLPFIKRKVRPSARAGKPPADGGAPTGDEAEARRLLGEE